MASRHDILSPAVWRQTDTNSTMVARLAPIHAAIQAGERLRFTEQRTMPRAMSAGARARRLTNELTDCPPLNRREKTMSRNAKGIFSER